MSNDTKSVVSKHSGLSYLSKDKLALMNKEFHKKLDAVESIVSSKLEKETASKAESIAKSRITDIKPLSTNMKSLEPI